VSETTDKFELPKAIDRYLAALSKLYASDGKRELQELIVNAHTRMHEAWSSNNWNGGTDYGHALYLVLPESLFINVAKQKEVIRAQIKDDLNNIHNIQNELIEEIFLEMEVGDDNDWRTNSGLLLSGRGTTPSNAISRIWGEKTFRVFLSHKSEVKQKTAVLKDAMRLFGVSCFVAHQDIRPTQAWQEEIENALSSMDAFVALMTKDFHESNWTDQEVGFAFARGVPIIAVRLGRDPYGFIGKFQALASTWEAAPLAIVKLLLRHDRMFSAYVQALRGCKNWNDGNTLGSMLAEIQTLSDHQVDELIVAYNETAELHGSFAFNGTRPRNYGPGLLSHFNRFGTRKFTSSKGGNLRLFKR
jgi:hypothetical protein